MRKHLIKSLVFVIGLLYCTISNAQFLMDMVDTTKETGKGLLNIYKKFDHLKISCYIQPQFQIAQSKGIPTFEGPDFNEEVNNRFLLRRSRLRFDYVHFEENNTQVCKLLFNLMQMKEGLL